MNLQHPRLGWMKRRRLRQTGALVTAWLLVAVPVAALVFVHSEKQTAIAGHDAVVSPTFDGYATLDLGPYLPSLRYPTDRRLGAHIDFGKTTLTSDEALVERYALLGAQPEGEIAKVISAIRGLAVDSAVSALGGASSFISLYSSFTQSLTTTRQTNSAAGRVSLRRKLEHGVPMATCRQTWQAGRSKGPDLLAL